MASLNRSFYADELSDPALRDRLFALTATEVGGQGADAQQAFLETLFNRAAARRGSLADMMSVYDPRRGTGYYPSLGDTGGLSDDQRSHFGNLLTRVMAGSDITRGATGNASGTVGFAGGPQTAAYGGERFGIEGPDVGKALPAFALPPLSATAYAPSDTMFSNLPPLRNALPPEILQGASNPAPAMPALASAVGGPSSITPNTRVAQAFEDLGPGAGGPTPNQRVADAFDTLAGGTPAGTTPAAARSTAGTLPPGAIPPEFMGGGGGAFAGGDLPLILMALGGGIAQNGIGGGFTNAAQLAAFLRKDRSGQTPADVREYQYAVSTGMFNGTYQDWLKFKGNLANKGGLNPIYYRDPATGEIKIGQPTTGGEFRPITTPGPVAIPQMQIDRGNQIDLTPRLAVPGAPGAAAPGATGVAPTAPGANTSFQKNFVPKGEQSKEGEFYGTQYAEFQKESINSTRVKGILDLTARLSPDAYSGAAAPIVQNVRSALSTFGIDPGKAPVGDMLTSLGNEMTIRSLGGLGRQISDGDRVYMASVFPSIADTMEGRKMKIEALRAMAQRQEDVAALAEQWKNDPNNNGSLKGFAQALAKWADQNPLFPDPRKGGGAPTGGGWSIQRLQ